MMKTKAALFLAAALLSSSCVSRSFPTYDSSEDFAGRLLGTVQLGDEEVGRYMLRNTPDGAPLVHRTIQRTYEVARVGVDARSVDKAVAADFGIEAWSGVLIDLVAEGSAAERAGLRPQDVLLELADKTLTSREQFVEVVNSDLSPGVETKVVVLRSSGEGQRMRVNLKLVPGVREVEESTTDRINLDYVPELEARTGMQVGTVPADMARDIWSTEAPRAFVSRVQLGSPAYLAGIRQGDQVLAVDGKEISTAAQLRDAIRGESGAHQVLVVGPDGEHDAQLEVVPSLDKKSSFFIPILIDHSSRMDRSQTAFLDFIFQFGFNHKSRYLRTESRKPARSSSLSILPLGMFEFERSPTKSKNTLFWLITWKTNR